MQSGGAAAARGAPAARLRPPGPWRSDAVRRRFRCPGRSCGLCAAAGAVVIRCSPAALLPPWALLWHVRGRRGRGDQMQSGGATAVLGAPAARVLPPGPWRSDAVRRRCCRPGRSCGLCVTAWAVAIRDSPAALLPSWALLYNLMRDFFSHTRGSGVSLAGTRNLFDPGGWLPLRGRAHTLTRRARYALAYAFMRAKLGRG